jgi:RND family efflux transporter MFP subunit
MRRHGLGLWVGVWLALAACADPASAEEASTDDADHAAGADEAPLEVAVQEIRLAPHYEVRRHYSGTLRGRRTSAVGFERGGQVVDVRADEGDRVAAGDVLARLDTDRLVTARRELRAQLDEAEAGVELAQATSARVHELADREFATEQRRDEVRSQLRVARSRSRRLQAALDRIEVDLAKSLVRAPFSGTVTARRADEGTVVEAGQPLVVLKEEGALEAVIGVPAPVAATLEPGSTHSLEVESRSVAAEVIAQIDDLDGRTRTVPILFRLEPTERLVPGQLARLSRARREPGPGAWVPLDALTEGLRGLWTLYHVVPGDDEQTFVIERIDVSVLHTADGRAFVRGTLTDGARIVATGVHRVVPGQRVTPVDGARPADAPTSPETSP